MDKSTYFAYRSILTDVDINRKTYIKFVQMLNEAKNNGNIDLMFMNSILESAVC